MSTDEQPFLETIRQNPDDEMARLVYADWLEERGDPRAEFLRLQARRVEIEGRLGDLMSGFSVEWLLRVTRKRKLVLRRIMPELFISVIKVVRELTGLGLKECVDFVHNHP